MPQRYAILVCGWPPAPVVEQIGGYGSHIERCLRMHDDEEWVHFDCEDGRDLPRGEDLDGFDVVIVSGSKHDAHSPARWVKDVGALAKRAVDGKAQRVLGICFGAQLLAHVLGGESGPAAVGWELGTRTVSLDRSKCVDLPYASRASSDDLVVMQCHRDQILTLPPGAERLGASPRCENEIFAIGANVLAVQGHPEMVPLTVREIIKARSEIITQDEKDRCTTSLEETPHPDPESPCPMGDLVRAFVHGPDFDS